MTKRAAIYARVSSQKQRDAHTIESQLHALRPFVVARGFELVGEYIDDGRSAKTGRLDKRDGFAQLLVAAGAGEIDVLVTAAMDRLTRTEDLIELGQILGPFQRLGVPIVSPTLGDVDLRTSHGLLQAFFAASQGAAANAARTDAIKRGKARAISEGRKPAGPTPFGLAYDRVTKQWAIDPVRGPIVREIFERVIRGESCLQISDDLRARGVPCSRATSRWCRHAVWRIVRSSHVFGAWTVEKRKRTVIAVPQIVSEEVWEAAQAKLMQHGKRGLLKTKHVYLLEGIATCATCSSPISIRSPTTSPSGRPNPAAYVCRSRKLARPDEERCAAPIVRVADADDLVWQQVRTALNSRDIAQRMQRLIDQRDANRKAWRADAATFSAKLDKLRERKAGVVQRFQRGLLDDRDLDTALAGFRREERALEDQIKTAEDGAARDTVPQVDVKRWLAAMRRSAESASPSERQRIVRAMVKPGSSVIDNGTVRMTLLVDPGDPIASDSADVLAAHPLCRTHHEEDRGVVSIQVFAEARTEQMIGQRFGRLIVLELAARATHGKSMIWKCRCDCGAITRARARDLRTGNTTSCGCLHRELLRERNARRSR